MGISIAEYLPAPIKLDVETQNHIESCLKYISGQARRVIMAEYFRLYQSEGLKRANLYLLMLKQGGSTKTRFESPAHKKAFECAEIIRVAGFEAGKEFFKEHGLAVPVGKLTKTEDPERKCVIARMINSDVWARKLKINHRRNNASAVYRSANNNICKGGEVYCPDFVVDDYVESQKDQASFLAGLIAISSENDEMAMPDIFTSSVANPVNRRYEMTNRMAGMENFVNDEKGLKEAGELAEDALLAGFICIFFTLTSPSKYHRKRWIMPVVTVGGKIIKKGHAIDNPNYQQEIDGKKNSPRLALDQQAKVKARVRAKLKRDDIENLGFSVVEPHHDGTPHQHIAMFVRPEDADKVKQIFRYYALEEDGDEPGAKMQPKPTKKNPVVDKYSTRRLDILNHDPEKGTVTAYMAKYISKGIAGFGIGEDFESGMDCDDAVLRVLAWKSLFGFRQFSFFGSPSVTLWRELRKIKEPFSNKTAEAVRLACDNGDWGEFTRLVKKHDISLVKANVVDDEDQEIKNKYGERLQRVVGVCVSDISGTEVIRTRFKEWFLVDLQILEDRIKDGLPAVDRENQDYLGQIENIIEQAKEEKKIHRLVAGTGGVIPGPVRYYLSGFDVYFNSDDTARILFATPT